MGNSVISKYVFIPPEATYTESYPYKVTYIPSRNGKRIPAYFLPAKKCQTKTTILYSHGNAADIGAMFDFLLFLHANLPVNILHYEYIGYGLAKSEGSPSENGTYESAEAALEYLSSQHQIKPSDCIIFGTSVGSGPSCHLASKYRCKGLILECPFTSCVRVVTNVVLLRAVDMFLNINKIDKVKCPVMIMHGKEDSIVPFEHGVELWKKVLKEYKYKNVWVDKADHHSIIPCLTHSKYIQHISSFINHCDTFVPPNRNGTVGGDNARRTGSSKDRRGKKSAAGRIVSLYNFSTAEDDVEFVDSGAPSFLNNQQQQQQQKK